MKASELSKLIDKLETKDKQPILEIIDLKIENDMKEVIAKLNEIQKTTKNEIKTIYWVVGLAMGIITILLAIIALKK